MCIMRGGMVIRGCWVMREGVMRCVMRWGVGIGGHQRGGNDRYVMIGGEMIVVL